MSWKTIQLPALLKNSLLDGGIIGVTIPYDNELVIGVGETLSIIFDDIDDILNARIESTHIVKYENITYKMSQESGYNSKDLFKYHLKELFKDTSDETYFIHYTFEKVNYANTTTTASVKDNMIKALKGFQL